MPGVPTGFAELDRELPGGGWPRGGLTELLPLRRGVGELSLLLPALARLSSDELAWLVCVASPHPLYAPALHESGVDLSRLLVASAPGRDAAWAASAHSRPMVLAQWSPGYPKPRATSLRRLQLAAEASRTLLFVFRPAGLCQSILAGTAAAGARRRGGATDRSSAQAPWRRAASAPANRHSTPAGLHHALAGPASATPAARSLSRPAVA
ncbi:MAG: SOS cell division inhibitor [Candidatus Accumulibacter necessarius]|uniref:SOS cell division inhibitor n=1 Tax=Candidatus Accumulibacter necessarius TaxID=2954386 RepID=UPI002FC27BFE